MHEYKKHMHTYMHAYIHTCTHTGKTRAISGYIFQDFHKIQTKKSRNFRRRGAFCTYVCTYICCTQVRVYVCMPVGTHDEVCVVCMYVCVCAWNFRRRGAFCMYVCTYVCMYAHIYVCMYVCTYICMYAGACVCMHACRYKRRGVSVCVNVCIWVYVDIHSYIHGYIPCTSFLSHVA